jgi:ADP-ribosylglycohydrolase
MTWMSGIALPFLALTTWSVLRKKPLIGAVFLLGGIGIEIALYILIPSRSPATRSKIISPQELSSIIEDLEGCYPIKPLDPIEIRNKQAGGLMGQACGDAIGLFTEFTTRQEAQEMIGGKPIDLGDEYPDGFKNGYNWQHIERFVKNGWTDDTDQALALLRALYRQTKDHKNSQNSSFDKLFANELLKWRKHGLCSEDYFKGRRNPYCMGLGTLVASVLEQPTFLQEPKTTAEQLWAKQPDQPLENRPAANGAVMRTSFIGLIYYRSFSDLISYTIEACKVTHADPRCIASCVAVTIAIALSLRGYDRDSIFDGAEKAGLAILRQELEQAGNKMLLSPQESSDIENLYAKYAEEFKAHLHGNWETLDLDEGYKEQGKMNKIGYTFKCMGAAFYALDQADHYQKQKKSDVFRLIIEEIAGEGGDADTNGAAAGALVGTFLGLKGQFSSNWTHHLADPQVLVQAMEHIKELSHLHQQTLSTVSS